MIRSVPLALALSPTTEAAATESQLTVPDIGEEVETIVTDWDRWLQFVDRETTLIAVGGLIAFILICLLRRPLAKGVVRILLFFAQPLLRHFTDEAQVIRHRLITPVSWLITSGAGLLILRLIAFPVSFEALLIRIFHTVALIALFMMLYQSTRLVSLYLNRKQQTEDQKTHVARKQRQLTHNASRYLATIMRAIVVVLGTVTILSLWFPNITGVIAGVGIGGLLLALAAQDTAANMFASIAIMLDHPFRVGDWVDTSVASGTVESIGLRSTRLRASDQSLITIPNSSMGAMPIVNGTTRRHRQIITDIYLHPDTTSAPLEAWLADVRAELPQTEGLINDSGQAHLSGITELGFKVRVAFVTEMDFTQMLETRERVHLLLIQLARKHNVTFTQRLIITE